MTAAASQDDPLVGQTLGSFRITSLIGVGGVGRVYLAEQPRIGGRVAIKVLSERAAEDKELIERFFAEARAVNLIRHEHIVNIIDLAYLPGGRPYIVMEYLAGQSLSDVFERAGTVPFGGLLRVAGEVLSALGAAHQKGVVHRDLKPANIFVTPAGHAKVLDFGLAKLARDLDVRARTTKSGQLIGTPHYMSPEQAASKAVDARCDLYAMGMILYEGIAGRHPFDADSLFAVLRHQIETPPAPLRQLRPELPEALEAVIMSALEKDPSRRPQGAREMAAALAASSRSLPAHAWGNLAEVRKPTPVAQGATRVGHSSDDTPPPTPITTPSRSRLPWILGGGAALCLALGVGVGLFVKARGGTTVVTHSAPPPSPDASAKPGPGPEPEPQPQPEPVRVPVPDAAPPVRTAAQRPPRPKSIAPTPTPSPGHPSLVSAPALTDPEDRGPEYVDGPASAARFDLAGWLKDATRLARGYYDDAELTMMWASGVTADGKVDLTDRGHAGYQFRSPRRSAPERRCYFRLDMRGSKIEVGAILPATTGDPCAWPIVAAPRCSVQQVWQEAIKLGADPNGRAYIRYLSKKGKPTWEFSVLGGGPDYLFGDDC